MLPVHQVRRQVDQIFGPHSEKVPRHNLLDRSAVVSPVRIGRRRQLPLVYRLALLLLGMNRGGERTVAFLSATGHVHAGE